MGFQTLNSKNFLDYAIHHYENPECKDMDEFSEDVNRIKYLKRLFVARCGNNRWSSSIV